MWKFIKNIAHVRIAIKKKIEYVQMNFGGGRRTVEEGSRRDPEKVVSYEEYSAIYYITAVHYRKVQYSIV